MLAPVAVGAAQGPGWQNPLTLPAEPGHGVADPGIIRYRGYYYLYSTGGDVRVWSSTDLVNWADRGLCLVGPVNGKAWAPRVLYYNGVFYLYASGDTGGVQKQSVYTSSSPMGPCVLAQTTLLACIDGLPFLNDNNQLYLYYAASGGIRYRTMPDPLNVAASSVQLTGCKVQTINTWTEAPHVASIDGTYFISYTGNDWTRNDYQGPHGARLFAHEPLRAWHWQSRAHPDDGNVGGHRLRGLFSRTRFENHRERLSRPQRHLSQALP